MQHKLQVPAQKHLRSVLKLREVSYTGYAQPTACFAGCTKRSLEEQGFKRLEVQVVPVAKGLDSTAAVARDFGVEASLTKRSLFLERFRAKYLAVLGLPKSRTSRRR